MRLTSQQYVMGGGALLLMTVLFGALYYHVAGRVQESALARTQFLTQHTADVVQNWLAGQIRTLKITSALVQNKEESGKALARVAGLSALSALDISLVLQLNAQELALYAKGARYTVRQDTDEADAWKNFLTRATEEGRIEAPVPSLDGKGSALGIAFPLFEENGRRFGVLAMSIPLFSLAEVVTAQRTLFSGNRLFFLTNEKNLILASSEAQGTLRTMAEDPALRTLPFLISAFSHEPLDLPFSGKKYLAAGAEIRGSGGWRFYLLSPSSDELDLLPVLLGAFLAAWVCLCFFVMLVLHQLRRHAHYKFLSERDHLTGAGNRLAFELALGRLEKLQEFPVCLIVMDMDGLKLYNDRLGHETGDALLRRVTLLLQRSLRENDAIYRIGGDEFAVIISGATYSMAEPLIARINLQAATMREVSTQPPVYISCGLAEARDVAGLSTLFIRADEAMYNMKNARRSMVSKEIIKWIEEHPEQAERRTAQQRERRGEKIGA